MGALTIITASIILLGAGYFFYGRILRRLFDIDPRNVTPANKLYDGVDYVPAKSWLVLFSHHFASIAGAGPIVGPVLAVAIWGWLPALLWIVFGTIFIGGVHDFAALVVSVRHRARSVADISEEVISRRAKLFFLGFVWFALVLVIAVFTSICAKTLSTDTKTVIPCFGLIGIALLVGFMLYRMRMHVFPATVIGLLMLIACIVMGDRIPIEIGPEAFRVWSLVLLTYAFLASVTPVHVLLQPRDYISSFLLYFGIAVGLAGIFLARPTLNAAAFNGWGRNSGEWLWPMLFVTVACGANSGFHALVSSGTTSKQLPNEKFAMRIGYGAMALEAILAVIALLAVASGLTPAAIRGIISGEAGGPIAAFGKGYAALTDMLLFGRGGMVAILILNAFILTTLDTATRIGRYISEELFKIKNRFFSTFVVVLASGAMALSGKWNAIWPMFGASNQLVAALTFIVVSSWLMCRNKGTKLTALPGALMLFTSIGALVWQLINFVKQGNFLLSAVSIILIVLASLMVLDVCEAARKRRLRCEI